MAFLWHNKEKKLNVEVLKVSKNYLKAPSGNVSKNSTDINVLLIKLKIIKTLISMHKVCATCTKMWPMYYKKTNKHLHPFKVTSVNRTLFLPQ